MFCDSGVAFDGPHFRGPSCADIEDSEGARACFAEILAKQFLSDVVFDFLVYGDFVKSGWVFDPQGFEEF